MSDYDASKLHEDCTFDNVEGVIQLFNVEVLKAVVNGDIDLNKLASNELANRGLNAKGDWVGFDRATELHENRHFGESK